VAGWGQQPAAVQAAPLTSCTRAGDTGASTGW
jgi:hypothetical protein